MRLDTRLTEHEETVLEKLIGVAQDGGDVADEIFDLDEAQYADGSAAYDLSVCRSLGKLGYIEYSKDDKSETWGDLTSLGYCYFSDKEKREAEEKKELWSNRRFQLLLAFFTFVLSIIASVASSFVTASVLSDESRDYESVRNADDRPSDYRNDSRDNEEKDSFLPAATLPPDEIAVEENEAEHDQGGANAGDDQN